MIRIYVLAIATTVAAFAGCAGCQSHPTPGPFGDGGDPCPAFCGRLSDAVDAGQACPAAGAACLAACRTDQGQGNAAQLDPIIACVLDAGSSAAAVACPGACR